MRLCKICVRLAVAFVVMSVAWVLLYKWVPVQWTPLMLKRGIQNVKVEDYKNVRTWVDIEEVAPVMVRAILASEDGKFMEHNGFDLQELRKMKREHKTKGKKIRGCSSVSQEVA